MIDSKKVRPCTNPYVDGTLDDGRLVEFKLNFFDILLTSLRFLINIIRNHSALQDRVVSRQIKSELPANKKSFFKLFF